MLRCRVPLKFLKQYEVLSSKFNGTNKMEVNNTELTNEALTSHGTLKTVEKTREVQNRILFVPPFFCPVKYAV